MPAISVRTCRRPVLAVSIIALLIGKAGNLWPNGAVVEAEASMILTALETIMTEGEARRLVARRAAPEVSGVFDRLTRVWQLAAYAHRMPEDEVVRVLCDEWPQAFGEAP